jgi:hypothetical protein
MFYVPWTALAWLEFWSAMNRVWLEPAAAASSDSRVVPFPVWRVRTNTAISRATGARIVRLSV